MCKIIPKPASADNSLLAKELFTLATASFATGSPWTSRQFAEDLALPQSNYFLAYHGDLLIGFVTFRQIDAEVELLELAVTPTYRRRGIAQRLWYEVWQTVQKKDPNSQVFLEVRTSNHEAQALYKRLGFQVVAKRAKYYQHPVEDAFIMVKEKEEQNGTGK